MNFKNKMLRLATVSSIAVGALTVPTITMAETSTSIAASNMYLWRGQNLTPHGGAISGSIDFSQSNGMYEGVWVSGEEGGSETDLYVGYSGEAGPISYDVSYWIYLYPEERTTLPAVAGLQTDFSDTDAAEIIGSVTFKAFTFTAYIQVDSDNADNNYFTFAGDFGKFNLTFGMWDLENAGGDEYTHLTLGYSATDEISMAVSIAQSDLNTNTNTGAVEEDPLFQITYSKSFDIK